MLYYEDTKLRSRREEEVVRANIQEGQGARVSDIKCGR